MNKFIRIILFQTLKHKTKSVPLGRWKILENDLQLMKRIDLANEDHCACKDYILQKQKTNSTTVTKKVIINPSL